MKLKGSAPPELIPISSVASTGFIVNVPAVAITAALRSTIFAVNVISPLTTVTGKPIPISRVPPPGKFVIVRFPEFKLISASI